MIGNIWKAIPPCDNSKNRSTILLSCFMEQALQIYLFYKFARILIQTTPQSSRKKLILKF